MMNAKTEGTLAVIAAFIVLLSAMWSPMVSAIISVFALAAFATYKFVAK